jgi:nitrogen regulatory protein PII
MESIKRVEIVTDASADREVESALRTAGATGWTVLNNVAGHGRRGRRSADLPMAVGSNVMFLIAVDAGVATAIAAAVEPILKRSGGICLVSDASWLGRG